MHRATKRFSFVMSGLFNPTVALLFSIFVCSLLFVKPLPRCDISVNKVTSNGLRRSLYFTPGIDLTSQFNFNVKQIFVYLRVIYKSGSSEILWSKIVQRGDKYVLREIVKNNYEIRGEVGTEVTLELRGNVFPYVGIIRDYCYGTVKCVI